MPFKGIKGNAEKYVTNYLSKEYNVTCQESFNHTTRSLLKTQKNFTFIVKPFFWLFIFYCGYLNA